MWISNWAAGAVASAVLQHVKSNVEVSDNTGSRLERKRLRQKIITQGQVEKLLLFIMIGVNIEDIENCKGKPYWLPTIEKHISIP